MGGEDHTGDEHHENDNQSFMCDNSKVKYTHLGKPLEAVSCYKKGEPNTKLSLNHLFSISNYDEYLQQNKADLRNENQLFSTVKD